ncbi:MAG: helix-turn-helix domain-containing protein [Oscillospiraceae bacterium]|jgi:AraC-like DNA-binding protein|nr:helix-turn-helix domain-containing protein [Oscillospiraceae bacterium]
MQNEEKAPFQPVQPYFVTSCSRYQQRAVYKNGISQIYQYCLDDPAEHGTVAVPDGCVDIVFDCTDSRVQAEVIGTVLAHRLIPTEKNHTYFGVRFLPGVSPQLLTVPVQELTEVRTDLQNILRDETLCERMAEAATFEKRAQVFLQVNRRVQVEQPGSCGSQALFCAVRKKIYHSDGCVTIGQLQEETGYSERYISRVFHEVSGISPKTFCGIVQFQRLMADLCYHPDTQLTQLAADYGYYDQPHFIRQFKKYTGLAPNVCRRLVKSYAGRIVPQN